MLQYDKKLAEDGYYVTKYEDRFFWDTPEILRCIHMVRKMDGKNMRAIRF